MKTTAKFFAAVLLTLPLLASAAGTRSTSFQVSFVVTDSCNVQSSAAATAATTGTPAGKAAAARPAVACQLSTPYLVTRNSDKASTGTSSDSNVPAIRPAAGAQQWTVYF